MSSMSALTRRVKAILIDKRVKKIHSNTFAGCCEVQCTDEALANQCVELLEAAGLKARNLGHFPNLGYWSVGTSFPK